MTCSFFGGAPCGVARSWTRLARGAYQLVPRAVSALGEGHSAQKSERRELISRRMRTRRWSACCERSRVAARQAPVRGKVFAPARQVNFAHGENATCSKGAVPRCGWPQMSRARSLAESGGRRHARHGPQRAPDLRAALAQAPPVCAYAAIEPVRPIAAFLG